MLPKIDETMDVFFTNCSNSPKSENFCPWAHNRDLQNKVKRKPFFARLSRTMTPKGHFLEYAVSKDAKESSVLQTPPSSWMSEEQRTNGHFERTPELGWWRNARWIRWKGLEFASTTFPCFVQCYNYCVSYLRFVARALLVCPARFFFSVVRLRVIAIYSINIFLSPVHFVYFSPVPKHDNASRYDKVTKAFFLFLKDFFQKSLRWKVKKKTKTPVNIEQLTCNTMNSQIPDFWIRNKDVLGGKHKILIISIKITKKYKFFIL